MSSSLRPEFKSKLAPTDQPLTFLPTSQTYFTVKDFFKIHTIILIGALVQLIACTLLPARYAAIPTILLLLNSAVTTLLQVVVKPNTDAFTRNVIHGRVSSQVPRRDGTFSAEAASEPLVVFNLGVQVNHPLGGAAPDFIEVGERFARLHADIVARREELGLLASSQWRGDDRASNSTLVTTYYFRDVESVHRFAHEPLHRDVWDWYSPDGRHGHIGVFHETYCVPRKGYETIFVNCHPVLSGRMTARKKMAEGGGDKWVNALVSADNPVLRTQYARLDRNEKDGC